MGIFTGQGAQWPRMGAQLVKSSPFAASRIAELDAALQNLPITSNRPSWTLKDQLLMAKESSRIAESAIAVNVVHVSGYIQAPLSNAHRLLKPGGFLVVGELASTNLIFSGMTVGTLPGWWIGAETSRP